MVLYTVKFRKWFFWRTIKNVKNDFWYDGNFILILLDESQVLVPAGVEVRISKERFRAMKKKAESNIGQPIQTNDTYGQKQE